MRRIILAAFVVTGGLAGSCARPQLAPPVDQPDGGDRPDASDFWYCELGQERCHSNQHQVCVPDGEFLTYTTEDCGDRGLICLDQLWCVLCDPGRIRCNADSTAVEQCAEDGSRWDVVADCDVGAGEICYNGECRNACDNAIELQSNVGCEYWAVDLDNASITVGEDASAQQFGVVVSNPGDVPTTVRVEINDALPGEPASLQVIEEAYVYPGDLEVFDNLPRREVDGTPPGQYDYQGNTPGTHLSSAAFRITSDHPVIAYQYNPLDNAGVFSNDASLLLPSSALGGEYAVMGWPQTIATSEDPNTNFDDNLRTFLTIVGTTADTHVSVVLAADTVVGDNLPARVAGETLDVTLGPFDVLNLETGSFNADFTGSTIEADQKVVVFSGSEASDVPWFNTLSERLCCADHLEEQLSPRDTLGRAFFLTPMPRRTPAVAAAGAPVAIVEEAEFFRVMAVDPGVTTVELSLPEYRGNVLSLDQNNFIDIAIATDRDSPSNQERFPVLSESAQNFSLVSDKRVSVGQVVASQQVVGIPNNLPGGDPAFILVPPTEQFRKSYVFLTPDLYAFDFMVIIAPRGATMEFDGGPLSDSCLVEGADGSDPSLADFLSYKCQLSFPELLAPVGGVGAWEVLPGDQNDGVHTLRSSEPVGLLLYGFDSFVSYGLAGGTDLKRIE
jgi:hypothetical protein